MFRHTKSSIEVEKRWANYACKKH